MDDNPPEFVTLQEMVDEIKRRCNSFVLITDRNVDERRNVHNFWFEGGFASAIGLLEITKAQLNHDYIHHFRGE